MTAGAWKAVLVLAAVLLIHHGAQIVPTAAVVAFGAVLALVLVAAIVLLVTAIQAARPAPRPRHHCHVPSCSGGTR